MFQITITVYSVKYISRFNTAQERTAFRMGVIESYELIGRAAPNIDQSIAV